MELVLSNTYDRITPNRRFVNTFPHIFLTFFRRADRRRCTASLTDGYASQAAAIRADVTGFRKTKARQPVFTLPGRSLPPSSAGGGILLG